MSLLLITNVRHDGRTHDILIENDRIARIGPRLKVRGARRLDGDGMTVLPSLFNAHTHAAMTLLRGYADDMFLHEWLETKIWPLEARLTEEDVYVGARLACLEMIRCGVTFFNDMYWHWRGTARAAEEMGVRALVAPVIIDLGDVARAKAAKQEILNLLENCGGFSRRLRFAFGPHAIYTVSGDTLRWLSETARNNGVKIHLHLSETDREVQDCVNAHQGLRPVEYLDSLGVLGPELIAAHGVHLNAREIEILARRGVAVAHMPESNMKLSVGGILPYTELRLAGVPVLLGTDGACSNNSLDLFQSLKFAALAAKHDSNDPTCLPAAEAWTMATRRAATVFGVDAGVVEVGRLADLILVDTRRPEFTPGFNLMSDLVYAANGYCVDTTLCDGRVLMHRRRVSGEQAILAAARRTARRLAGGGEAAPA
ncbi:MAG: amidohydrolase [Lentisphaeria bacterium]